MTVDLNSNNERRKGAQRRRVNLGPPPNIGERRVNLERRLFDLVLDGGAVAFGSPGEGSAQIRSR